MNFDLSELSQLMITTKKKAGLVPCMAGLIEVIRQVCSCDASDAEKISFISEACKLSKKHLKV